MDTDVIEKAAEVLAGRFGPGWDKLPLDKTEQRARLLNQRGGFVPDITKADCLDAAQAAYTAIVGGKVLVDREPSEAMTLAGMRHRMAVEKPNIHDTAGIWTAMLNASEGV